MVAVNRKGYFVKQRIFNKITNTSRDWWLVKPSNDNGAIIQVGKCLVKVNPEFIGKRFRIKIEVI